MKPTLKCVFLSLIASGLAATEAFAWGKNINGSGVVKTEVRNVSGFSAVSLSTIGHVTIRNTGQESLTVSAEDNLLPYIVSRVEGNTLYLETPNNISLNPTQPIEFTLQVKQLDGLKLSGAGSIDAADMQGDDISVKLSGAGDIKIKGMQGKQLTTKLSGEGSLSIDDIQGEHMSAKLSGVGSMKVAGKADTLELKLSGAGSYKGGSLSVRQATIKNSGVGSAVVNVSERLDAKLSGVGSVEYIGSPEVRQSVSGVGSIRQR